VKARHIPPNSPAAAPKIFSRQSVQNVTAYLRKYGLVPVRLKKTLYLPDYFTYSFGGVISRTVECSGFILVLVASGAVI
jgi:hypothetical protein